MSAPGGLSRSVGEIDEAYRPVRRLGLHWLGTGEGVEAGGRIAARERHREGAQGAGDVGAKGLLDCAEVTISPAARPDAALFLPPLEPTGMWTRQTIVSWWDVSIMLMLGGIAWWREHPTAAAVLLLAQGVRGAVAQRRPRLERRARIARRGRELAARVGDGLVRPLESLLRERVARHAPLTGAALEPRRDLIIGFLDLFSRIEAICDRQPQLLAIQFALSRFNIERHPTKLPMQLSLAKWLRGTAELNIFGRAAGNAPANDHVGNIAPLEHEQGRD